MIFTMAVQPGRLHGVDVGQAFRDVLYDEHMSLKEASLTMGYPESSYLCRASQGEKGYDFGISRLLEMPDQFLLRLFSRLMVEKRKMAKAELRPEAANKECA